MTVNIDELRTNPEIREKARKSKKCTVILSSGKKAEFENDRQAGTGTGSCDGNLSKKDKQDFDFALSLMMSQ